MQGPCTPRLLRPILLQPSLDQADTQTWQAKTVIVVLKPAPDDLPETVLLSLNKANGKRHLED